MTADRRDPNSRGPLGEHRPIARARPATRLLCVSGMRVRKRVRRSGCPLPPLFFFIAFKTVTASLADVDDDVADVVEGPFDGDDAPQSLVRRR